MATGIIGVLTGAGTITYTPISNAKVNVTYTGANGCQINGSLLIPGNNSGSNNKVDLWLGANQTLTVTLYLGATSPGSVIVSALES